MRKKYTKDRGFTIVELLVVIGIIALLLAMLLPALSGAKRRAKKTDEMNHIRQIGLAWVLYANSNNDAALPGHLSPGTQQSWRVSYKFRDGSKVPPGGSLPNIMPPEPVNTDDEDNVAGPWTFRLLPYMEHNHDIIHGYLNEDIQDDLHLITEAPEVAQHPSFAYNGRYIGGVYHRVFVSDSDGGDPIDLAAPQYNWSKYRTYHGVVGRANPISKTVTSISRAAQVITFCSAAPMPKGLIRDVPDNQLGGHLVDPPYVERNRMWGPSSGLNDFGNPPGSSYGESGPNGPGGGGGGAGISDGGVAAQYEVFEDGATVPIARYTNLAVVLYADNHIEQAQPLSLFDQRKWINSADAKIWVHEGDIIP